MNILSGGCSFIWGNELSDCYHPNCSQLTWPALIARDMNMGYHCVAVPGASNTTIARQIMRFIEQSQRRDWFVIVQWTFASRQEFRFNRSIPNNRDQHYFSISPWTVTNNPERDRLFASRPNDSTLDAMRQSHNAWSQTGVLEFSDQYFKHISCEDTDAYMLFKEIVLLKLYLESQGIGYAFSSADSQLIRTTLTEPHSDTSLAMYARLCQDIDWLWFDGMGFYEWAQATGQKQGVALHPLDHAHAKAAKLIKDQIHENIKIHR